MSACAAAAGPLPAPAGPVSAPASTELAVPGLRCAGCIRAVERGLMALPGVSSARVNLSRKRVRVGHDPALADEDALLAALERLGFPARRLSPALAEDGDPEGRALLTRIGVAGFAAMNVMLLSVSVWSGAEGETGRFLQWVAASIALPSALYAGQPFFRNALRALRAGRLDMDVPISLAVLLTLGLSVWEVLWGRGESWFEASTGLLFFLLAGRYLDHAARRAARSAAAELARFQVREATRLRPDGTPERVAVEALSVGDRVLVRPGDRLPADGVVLEGASDIDRALVTGESVPEPASPGDRLHAGTANLTGRLVLEVAAVGDETLLARIARMVEAAETARAGVPRLAERAVRLYAPGVHLVALLAAAGWLAAGAGALDALRIAAATLIITCPCALGLAIPAVQAVASGRLFRRGIFLRDGGALEALAAVDTVVFDKTGTLTEDRAEVIDGPATDGWAEAAALASASRHPLARAIAAEAGRRGVRPAALDGIREVPGSGMAGRGASGEVRLGSAAFCETEAGTGAEVWLARPGRAPVVFRLSDRPRADARATVAALRERGLAVRLLSGDRSGSVEVAARACGIADAAARRSPGEKLDALHRLRAAGHRVLMVGDGLNDAPSLAGADVSMAPAAASDVAQTQASLVFPEERLLAVVEAIDLARAARRRMVQNLAFAALYNAVAIPVAVAGLASPLVAAIAMSASSIVVTLNALRLRVPA